MRSIVCVAGCVFVLSVARGLRCFVVGLLFGCACCRVPVWLIVLCYVLCVRVGCLCGCWLVVYAADMHVIVLFASTYDCMFVLCGWLCACMFVSLSMHVLNSRFI